MASPQRRRRHAPGELGPALRQCHGANGAGTTRLGTLLKVRDLTKAEVQAAFNDAAARTAIEDGVKDPTGRFTMNPYGAKLSRKSGPRSSRLCALKK